MADEVRTIGDLYAPPVWKEAINNEFRKRLLLASAAIIDDTLTATAGATVTLPRFDEIGEFEDFDRGDTITFEEQSQSIQQATVKSVAKGVLIYDVDRITGIGNMQDNATGQIGQKAATRVDADLYKAATLVDPTGFKHADGTPDSESAPLVLNAGAGETISYAHLVTALALAGDTFNPADYLGIFINMGDWAKISVDPQFISAAQAPGYNALLNGGLIGTIQGIPVRVTNTVEVGKTLIIRRNALVLYYKKNADLEFGRDDAKRALRVSSVMSYAAKRVDDKGITVINWNVA